MTAFEWAPEVVRDLLTHRNGKLCIRCELCGKVRTTSGRKQVIDRASETYRQCRQHNTRFQSFDDTEIASWPAGQKRCNSCQELKTLEEFHAHSLCVLGRANQCKECRKPVSKAEWLSKSFESSMLATARFRAKTKGIPFDIDLSDIVVPENCPILGVKISDDRGDPYCPSLDRIEPKLGYVKGNVQVTSRRGNVLKSNMTKGECQMLLNWFQLTPNK